MVIKLCFFDKQLPVEDQDIDLEPEVLDRNNIRASAYDSCEDLVDLKKRDMKRRLAILIIRRILKHKLRSRAMAVLGETHENTESSIITNKCFFCSKVFDDEERHLIK